MGRNACRGLIRVGVGMLRKMWCTHRVLYRLLGTGLGNSRQVYASLGKSAATEYPDVQANERWAEPGKSKQVEASQRRQEIVMYRQVYATLGKRMPNPK